MWKRGQSLGAYRPTDSLIGHGGTLEGKVHCDTNLRIEGTFSGEIVCSGTVTVGEQGTVRSSIHAEEVIIAGKVFGDVTAQRRLIMAETGQLQGNIQAQSLTIHEGSLINGSIEMHEQPAPDTAGGLDNSIADKANSRASAKQSTLEAG
ncbi:bactofilin family protein [Paenibacillus donghaensis]|uniref:Cell division protein n=1 Tax=Paenibacillus donghaensis TaxID=414771 RepID=A0A2Z2KH03_9BACL|nr:polymer-forming cytoskeletal protein [Paenibacillus donghaensis]ASA26066.1 cell division protein [Paenibacillus donghaensis]